MELILKAAASALLTAAVGLLLKKQNPEIALLLGAVTALGILFASLKIVDGLGEHTHESQASRLAFRISLPYVCLCHILLRLLAGRNPE